MRSSVSRIALGIAALLTAACAPAAYSATPAQACAAAQSNAVARTIQGLSQCAAKAVKAAVGGEIACEADVRNKFAQAWLSAVSQGGCVPTNDETAVQATVDALYADLRGDLG